MSVCKDKLAGMPSPTKELGRDIQAKEWLITPMAAPQVFSRGWEKIWRRFQDVLQGQRGLFSVQTWSPEVESPMEAR